MTAIVPVLAASAIVALLAAFGWRWIDLSIAAAVILATALAFATVSLYRHATQQQFAQRALRDVEARIGGIVDTAMDAIVTVDEDQRIVLFNQAAEAVFRCPRIDAIGAPLDQFIPARFRSAHVKHMLAFGKSDISARRMGPARIVTGLRHDGEEFPIDASISHITENGRKFYTVILRDITERIKAQEALQRSKEELRELAAAAAQLREQEKRGIARELHDELAQALTGLKMDVAWIQDKLPAPTQPIADKLRVMQSLLDSTVAATRRISSDLRPMMLDDLGLIPAVEWLVQNFTERTHIPCRLSIPNPAIDLRDPLATSLFRILQESLTNIAKHAQAAHVDVTLEADGGAFVMRVRDDGVGFPPQNPRKPNSYGLIGMHERAYLLGGTVTVGSQPGRGTCIDVRLPLPA